MTNKQLHIFNFVLVIGIAIIGIMLHHERRKEAFSAEIPLPTDCSCSKTYSFDHTSLKYCTCGDLKCAVSIGNHDSISCIENKSN